MLLTCCAVWIYTYIGQKMNNIRVAPGWSVGQLFYYKYKIVSLSMRSSTSITTPLIRKRWCCRFFVFFFDSLECEYDGHEELIMLSIQVDVQFAHTLLFTNTCISFLCQFMFRALCVRCVWIGQSALMDFNKYANGMATVCACVLWPLAQTLAHTPFKTIDLPNKKNKIVSCL